VFTPFIGFMVTKWFPKKVTTKLAIISGSIFPFVIVGPVLLGISNQIYSSAFEQCDKYYRYNQDSYQYSLCINSGIAYSLSLRWPGLALTISWALVWTICAILAYNAYRTKTNGSEVHPEPSNPSVLNIPPKSSIRQHADIIKTVPQLPLETHVPVYSAPRMVDWTKDDVSAWLNQNGNEELSPMFKSNSIDGLALSTLTVSELITIGINLGKAKKLVSLRDAI
jgi:hypothetical protein